MKKAFMKKAKPKLDNRALIAVLLCTTFTFGTPFSIMAAETQEDKDAKVVAKNAEDDNDFLLGGVVVTATRTEVEQFNANANVSVITAKDIENNHWRDLSDALRSVPGVYIGNFAQAGYQSSNSLYINGSNDIVVLIDGVKVNIPNVSAKFSPTMFTNLDNIERIEILKGSASTLYGSDAKGGVIHIITKKADGVKTTFKVGAGSFGVQNYSFGNEGRENGWVWRVQYQKSFAGDFKDGNGNTWESYLNADTTSLSLTKEFGKDSDLTLTYDSYKTGSNKYTDFYWGSLTDFDIDNNTTKLIYNTRFGDKTTNQLSYSNSIYDTNLHGDGAWGPWSFPTKIKTQRISDQFTRIINESHTLTAGFEYTYDKIEATTFSANYDETMHNNSVYIQDEWNITNQLKLTGGLRYDKPSLFDSHTTPSINLGYKFNPKTNMYISYSEYFITPTVEQLFGNWGDASITPESGNTSELGVNHRFDNTFVVSAHMFKRNSKNRIGFVSSLNKFDNVGDEKADGWDIQIRKQFAKSINAYVGYTHTNVDPTDARDRNVDGHIPKGAWNLGVDYNKDKLGITLAGRGVIDRQGPSDAYGGVFFPATTYWVWDIGINYQTSPHAKVFLKVNNIFDKYYAEQSEARPSWGNPGQWYAMPGRNIYAGMQYSF